MRINSSGTATFQGSVLTDEIRCRTWQQLVLNAGESASYATGQGDEYVYINAEKGLQVNTNNDNWSSGWAGRKTATIKGDSITVDGAINAGNATFDNGTDTTVDIRSDDSGKSELRLYGNSQGTGRLYVGQATNVGGGIEYNGDSNPVTSGGGSDYITLFRRVHDTDHWTARNYVDNNNWEFRGNVKSNGNIEATGSLTGAIKTKLFNEIYPVGSIFTTTSDSFNPVSAFGGTWSLHGGGRVLVGDNGSSSYSVNQTGGSSTHNHTTTVTRDGWGSEGYDLPRTTVDGRLVSGSGNYETGENLESLAHVSGNKTFTSNSKSNFPPYIVVKFWKRTGLG